MQSHSILIFDDLSDSPSVHAELPSPIHLGTKINLDLVVQRRNGGRTEELRIKGTFKVSSVSVDTVGSMKQIVHVAATGIAPIWKAIKNQPLRLPLAKFPRTEVK